MGLWSVRYGVRAVFVRSRMRILSPCFHSVSAALKSNETHGTKSNGFWPFLLWRENRTHRNPYALRRTSDG